jgi:hypothetical protein
LSLQISPPHGIREVSIKHETLGHGSTLGSSMITHS